MNLPEAFVKQSKTLFGEEYAPFEAALNGQSSVSIRINPSKGREKPSLENVPWCSTGFYLETRPSFTFDPLFHAGCYYVQEASSMFLEQAIQSFVREPVVCLDLCAAPGGKSTHLSSVLPEGSLLVANEVIRSRAYVLSENLIKWGNPFCIITNNDPSEIGKLAGLFDVILTDVPCSGEGMFRKDPNAVNEWSPANVNLCAERQRRIVADVWPALKPGGILIYSTCTYNTPENEENISWITETLGGEVLRITTDPSWKIKENLYEEIPAYRFMPHRVKGEGFFMAVIRKKETDNSAGNSRKVADNKKQPNKGVVIPQEIRSWMTDSENYSFSARNNEITAFPSGYSDLFYSLRNVLKVIHAGITVCEIKGKDLIPHHALSMSTQFRRDSFSELELDEQAAISYLRKEALFNLPENTPKGFLTVMFNGHPLGFVKNIGNRANNLYPQEWRIRKF